MPIPIPKRALLLLCGLTAGCAQTARVQCWQPADFAAGDLSSVAVVGAADHVDQQAVLSLERQIQRKTNFEVVAHRNEESRIVLAGYLDDAGPGLEGLLQYGRQADVDAVVIVDVQEFDLHESPRGAWSWESVWRAPRPNWTAEVRLDFQLIDTTTGEVLASREMTRSAPSDDGEKTKATTLLLYRLLDDCVGEFVTELEPRQTDSTIELADGSWYTLNGSLVRRGVRLARRGRWQQAEDAWNRALAHNAHDDAALFNLAVASAQTGDYGAAEDFAMEALRIRHTECYAAGLEQIRSLRTAREEVEQQMRTAVLPAGFMDDNNWLLQ